MGGIADEYSIEATFRSMQEAASNNGSSQLLAEATSVDRVTSAAAAHDSAEEIKGTEPDSEGGPAIPRGQGRPIKSISKPVMKKQATIWDTAEETDARLSGGQLAVSKQDQIKMVK